ncbi:NAD-dependent epimerase/dehydratase family protein [Micromonospora sp. CB01531]|uniref:NAD-dependent epimerase/dehydratase family protein n=1 Tax=Micromonospora sp. CB01531 TaxID=1718947 RepID=UPI00093D5535|nr:NAD-dependent epimerase/dehydratase family protein [Micromonospora sp. CB01531]OKI63419.1 NAD-dependent epimerase [Micromonospora sp. CB01531]
MPVHLIVGAGAVGAATALLLAERGEQVRVVSRRGGGPVHEGVERLAADAADADQLSRLADGVTVVYNCANPAYHRWLTDWPPLASAVLTAAERSGAVLATAGNLYGYGPVAGPMTESTPLAATNPKLRLRADMWRAALAAHEAGRLRATEVRASDYIEANSILTISLGKPLLAGTRAYVPAPLDVPHSWTSITDVARTLVTVATDSRAWGRPWHVPTNPAVTVRELASRFSEVADAPAPKLTSVPYPALWAIGIVSPLVRELRATRYQFDRPFVIDSSLATKTFGIEPTPMEEALGATVTSLRGPA